MLTQLLTERNRENKGKRNKQKDETARRFGAVGMNPVGDEGGMASGFWSSWMSSGGSRNSSMFGSKNMMCFIYGVDMGWQLSNAR